MRALSVLVRIRLLEIVRHPSGALWFFGLPLVLLALVAGLFANGHPFERRHVAVVGNSTAVTSALGEHVRTGACALDPMDLARARARLDTHAVSAIVIASAARAEVIVGERDEPFGRGIVSQLREAPVGLAEVTLEITTPVANGYVRYLFPGMLAQGVVVSGLFGMGYAMTRYRQSRFLRKLSTTPLSRAEFVLAQVIARLVVMTAQLLVLLLAARYGLGIPLSAAALASVLIVGALGVVTFMGLGFVISCFVESEAVVVDLINVLGVPIALLSEIFFSVDELPRPLAWFASSLPSTTMVRAMRAVLLHGEDVTSTTLSALAILAAWAVVSYAVAVRSFRWR